MPNIANINGQRRDEKDAIGVMGGYIGCNAQKFRGMLIILSRLRFVRESANCLRFEGSANDVTDSRIDQPHARSSLRFIPNARATINP